LCISIQFEWNPLMEMNKGLEDFKKKNKLQPPTNKITCIQYIYIYIYFSPKQEICYRGVVPLMFCTLTLVLMFFTFTYTFK
jgi:hypothetical protein